MKMVWVHGEVYKRTEDRDWGNESRSELLRHHGFRALQPSRGGEITDPTHTDETPTTPTE